MRLKQPRWVMSGLKIHAAKPSFDPGRAELKWLHRREEEEGGGRTASV